MSQYFYQQMLDTVQAFHNKHDFKNHGGTVSLSVIIKS
ncbi:hypothetical protein SPONN_1856 [uncultured Candidatus Thioglobus sp.]|nr:hypothetical protein SPONN_1856 [uncultured Candidatus Thioglobus sp.]